MKSNTHHDVQKPRIIMIGNGMVGHHCVEQLIELGGVASFDIHIFSDESRRAYDRVHLSEYFTGRSGDALSMAAPDFYATQGITLHLSTPIVSIDRDASQVHTATESWFYDKLIFATGSYPFVPPIPGAEGAAGLVYRTLDDLDAIQAAAKGAKRGVVIGGGLLGLEAANALRSLGLEAHVVEFAPRLMPVQLDDLGAAALKAQMEALGVHIHVGKATQRVEAGSSLTYRLCFGAEDTLETDLIVFSAGIRPHDALARAAGLQTGSRGGIAIDDYCVTSDPDIYAIGECAAWSDRIFGLVAPGYRMARTAAEHLCRLSGAPFTGADLSTKLKLLGVDVGSIGDAHGQTPGAVSYRFIDEKTASYRRLVVSADGRLALGAVLVGDNSFYDTLSQYVLNQLPLPPDPAQLILPVGDQPVTLGVDALPGTATICSCHNVNKNAICSAIDGGCGDVASVKACTKAGTGCGGCSALLKQVVEHELITRGVAIDTSLCEHFAHDRQTLYHLVRVEGIQSFSELIQRHGRSKDGVGLGCDVCKPVVASILASCWNEPIQQPHLVPLQDTNDTFMANMQKNGTYSVVPRIPGGEITPDKLIAIGVVAKKYDLYTKITGGQRIDLFGAQLHELPEIWSELIEAGFETGHAYGKSTRTVKSCVGSTWCRYGVQDSVAMALHLENRYKGLRSPHKLKFAVSGCTRECAEAQSKDVGVIATDRGWNLYVAGNGGMRPRHAELFATDLDDTMLIKLIDRFLMFYIKTAGKLQRTSVWRESLEGGLDYLKDVLIEDRLGIADELESQMQWVVDHYECEWANALKDEEKLKRFKTFVNQKGGDSSIHFVRERGQRRPARPDEIPLIAESEVSTT